MSSSDHESDLVLSLQNAIFKQNEEIISLQSSLSSFFSNVKQEQASLRNEIEKIRLNHASLLSEYKDMLNKQNEALKIISEENEQLSSEIQSLKKQSKLVSKQHRSSCLITNSNIPLPVPQNSASQYNSQQPPKIPPISTQPSSQSFPQNQPQRQQNQFPQIQPLNLLQQNQNQSNQIQQNSQAQPQTQQNKPQQQSQQQLYPTQLQQTQQQTIQNQQSPKSQQPFNIAKLQLQPPAVPQLIPNQIQQFTQMTQNQDQIQKQSSQSQLYQQQQQQQQTIFNKQQANKLLNGLFANLAFDNHGNPVEKGVLTIIGTSQSNKESEKLKFIIDNNWTESWCSVASPNDDSFITFDFNRRFINISAYTIRTSSSPEGGTHLKSWVLEGTGTNSPEGGCSSARWVEIDSQNDCTALNGPSKVNIFQCKNSNAGFFRRFRLRQTGPSCKGSGTGFSINNIEFFGQLRNT